MNILTASLKTLADAVRNGKISSREITEKYLKEKGFNYHGLLMGKPRGGNYHWIDNHMVRATRYTGKFTDLIEKQSTIQVFEE